MQTGEIVIDAREACYRYEGARDDAVAGACFQIARGEFVAVLGRNGSGKSTLGKLLNALILPSSGEISVFGLSAKNETDALTVRKRCGMVFQNPDNQIVATIVEEDVAFGCENLGVAPAEIRERVTRALETVGMSEYAMSAPHMLSGGQKQRVAIAGVIAMQPEIIVFDEATAMLDPAGRAEIRNLALRLNQEKGVTVVWITHFMEEAASADRLIIMDGGRIVKSGKPGALFEDMDGIASFGLEAPPMIRLSHALRARGLAIPEGVMTTNEMAVELCRLKSKT